MKTNIIMPKIGLSTKPLTIIEWKFKECEYIKKGEIAVTVETEKIRYDIEAPGEGYLHIITKEGEEVPIGNVIGIVFDTKEECENSKEVSQNQTEEKIKDAVISESISSKKNISMSVERIKISPLARKLAEKHMIDIAQVKGSGPDGRIIKEDIEQFLEDNNTMYDGKKVKKTVLFTRMRKTIADHMHESLSISAQITVMGEINAYELVHLREQLLNQEEKIKVHITYTDLLVYVVSRVLPEFDLVNSSIINNEIKVWENINIGVAVALDEGLIVPVVKNADKKSLIEISKNIKELSRKARTRTLDISEVKGSTFSLTNLGAFGGGYRYETVIINQPESAILGTGGIVDRPYVIDKQIVIRPIMTYYLTYDHRVVDGALAAKFIGKIKQAIENINNFMEVKL